MHEPDKEPTIETPVVDGSGPEPPTEMMPAATTPTAAAGGPTDTGGGRRKLALIVLGVLVAGLAAGALAFALLRSDNSTPAATDTSSTSSTDHSASTSTSAASSTSVSDTSTPATTASGGGGGTTPATGTSPTTESTAVRFTTFTATQSVTCLVHNPESSSTVPASSPDVTLSWSTAFAATVDVSVDGPGVYQSNIGAAGSMSIPFGCPGPHTYTLTAHGVGGTSATKSVSVTSHP